MVQINQGRRPLSANEARAISELKRLAKRWPKTLKLFSWSGSLVVMDANMEAGAGAELDWIDGIPNDGGDPA